MSGSATRPVASAHRAFVLAGNGPSHNRGCEGIDRGTMAILSAAFPGAGFVLVPFSGEPEGVSAEPYPGVPRLALPGWTSDRTSPRWLARAALGAVAPAARYRSYVGTLGFMVPHVERADAVLSVGGDNYSLDWGPPDIYWALDEFALRHDRPIVLWGASVGPFSARPAYERFAIAQLKRVSRIMAREDRTVEYLARHGVIDNVTRVADPAFAMDAAQPEAARLGMDPAMLDGAIGLNLAPLLGRYLGQTYAERVALTARVIEAVAGVADAPLVLAPHVTYPPGNDDHAFMAAALAQAGELPVPVAALSPGLNAPEMKWAISRLSCLVASRMHAAIAGHSSGVPTITIAYSMKAAGVTEDVYGHPRYLLPVAEYGPGRVVEALSLLRAEAADARARLAVRVPELRDAAFDAGRQLATLIGG